MAKILIACYDGDILKTKEYEFNENTDIEDFFCKITDCYGFKIPNKEDRDLWNNKMRKDWAGFDDNYYYYYDMPIVDTGEWYDEIHGIFEPIDIIINIYERNLKRYKEIKEKG